EELHISVKAKGFSLLGYRLKTSFLPITCNVSSYATQLQQSKSVLEFTLNTNDIKDKIGAQISPNIKLLKVYPEEILFKFAMAKHRKVVVRPAIDYTLKRQYILNHITTTPDSIWVSGPAAIVDTLEYIATAPWHLKELKKNIHRKLKLIPLPSCTFNEEEAEVSIEVEQFTEAKRTLPITACHVPDSMNIRLFPTNVNISYEIGLSKYEQVTDEDFIFSIEYPKDPNINFLEVKASQLPAFIKNLTYSPQKVEYILEKK
ncbi:MAG: YbbR-like domain-containing protein, partial [Odoribacter sp.]|nr:YbbR-like domain-containing protein [Odoribacter sp.]